MNVGELIDLLKRHDAHLPVMLRVTTPDGHGAIIVHAGSAELHRYGGPHVLIDEKEPHA